MCVQQPLPGRRPLRGGRGQTAGQPSPHPRLHLQLQAVDRIRLISASRICSKYGSVKQKIMENSQQNLKNYNKIEFKKITHKLLKKHYIFD